MILLTRRVERLCIFLFSSFYPGKHLYKKKRTHDVSRSSCSSPMTRGFCVFVLFRLFICPGFHSFPSVSCFSFYFFFCYRSLFWTKDKEGNSIASLFPVIAIATQMVPSGSSFKRKNWLCECECA